MEAGMRRALYRMEDQLFYRGVRRLTVVDCWCHYLSDIAGRAADFLARPETMRH